MKHLLFLLILISFDLAGQTSYEGIEISRDTTFFVPSSNGRVPANGDGFLYDHFIYIPTDYDSSRAIPLVIDLHGTGESGITGFMKDVSFGRKLPFIVLGPNSGTINGFYNEDALDSLLRQAVDRFNVDTNKIYLTGISRGAMAAANFASKFPHKIAGLALFAGQIPPVDDFNIQRLSSIPTWIVNGEFDFLEGYKLHDQLNAIPGSYSRYNWVYDEEHDESGWQVYYQNPRLEKWLLAQNLQEDFFYELEMKDKNQNTISLGYFNAGDEFNIFAPLADTGESFVKWFSNNGGIFGNESRTNTSFIMPNSDVRIFPTYTNISCSLEIENGIEPAGLRIKEYTTLTSLEIPGLKFSHWESNLPGEIPKPWQSRFSIFDAKTIYVKDTCIPLKYKAIYDTLQTPILRGGNVISANFVAQDFFGVHALDMYESDFAGANSSNWWNNLKLNAAGGSFVDLLNDAGEQVDIELEVSVGQEDGGARRTFHRNQGNDRLMLFTNQFLGANDLSTSTIHLKGSRVPFNNYQLIVYFTDQNNSGFCEIKASLNGRNKELKSPLQDEDFYSRNWFSENTLGESNMMVFNNITTDSFLLSLEVQADRADTRLAISGIQLVDGRVSLDNHEKPGKYIVYPNPSKGQIRLEPMQNDPVAMRIYNVMGQLVLQQEILNEINLPLENGIYFVELYSEFGRTIKKLIIER